jgi:hypothetical protein
MTDNISPNKIQLPQPTNPEAQPCAKTMIPGRRWVKEIFKTHVSMPWFLSQIVTDSYPNLQII